MTELHIVWVGVCTTLVFFMQAGFAFLESGASRAKNSVNVLMKNYMDMCLGGIIFWGFGFGLMFGKNLTGWIGSDQFFLQQFSMADAIKMTYQIMFAATAATIVSGAVAERMHFVSYLIFSALVTGIIYPIYGSWTWNENGWLATMGFVDFAGSTVVHSVGGWCALAAITVLGPRLGRYSRQGDSRDIPGHSLPFVGLGGFILWLGWFGFNGGSIASFEDNNIGLILLNTHLGGCAGGLGALLLMVIRKVPVLMSATVNGSVAGLVSITAGASSLTPLTAIVVGFIGGMVYIFGVELLNKRQLDDVVGAVSVHGLGGAWGTIAVALFPQGSFSLSALLVQMLGVGAAFIWTFPVAYGSFKLLDQVLGVKASSLHEQRGLDYTEHYEIAYPEFQKRLDIDA